MKTKYENAFDNYLKEFDMDNKQIRFKYYHSYEVEKLMNKLATMLNFNKDDIELSKVIGLLHDTGRFPQIKKYGSCSDTKTHVDHALLGCNYLFDENHIKDFYDEESEYNIIYQSIKNHNKYEIDKDLKNKELLFSKMIRDTDKIDIYRVILEEYDSFFNKNEVSSKVLESFKNKQTIESKYLKTETDEVYSYISFIFDINFKESFIILKERGYLNKLLDKVIVDSDSIDEFNKIKNYINNYIDNKIKD